MTDAHPLVVDDAEGPVTAQVEVNGQAVNAILLQPVTAEAAKEAASHQIVAPRYGLYALLWRIIARMSNSALLLKSWPSDYVRVTNVY